MISIIVPVYNAEKSIRRCINSVLAQLYKDWEIILVDDGSPDESGALCDAYVNSYSQIHVYHKENGGVGSARNLGLDKAKGDWVCFIDADDCIDENFIQDLNNEKCLLVLQNWAYSNNAAQNVESYYSCVCKDENLNTFLSSYMNRYIMRTPWGKFFRRDIIEQHHIRFDERFRVGEDTLFVLQYLKFCTSIRILSASRYIYTLPETEHSTKYNLPINIALSYLKTFEITYLSQPYRCKNLVLFIRSFIFECVNRITPLFRLYWMLQPINIRLRKLSK